MVHSSLALGIHSGCNSIAESFHVSSCVYLYAILCCSDFLMTEHLNQFIRRRYHLWTLALTRKYIYVRRTTYERYVYEYTLYTLLRCYSSALFIVYYVCELALPLCMPHITISNLQGSAKQNCLQYTKLSFCRFYMYLYYTWTCSIGLYLYIIMYGPYSVVIPFLFFSGTFKSSGWNFFVDVFWL